MLNPNEYVSMPNFAVRRIVETVEPYEFDRIYGAWRGKVVFTDGKAVVARSGERYIRAIQD